MKKTKTTYHTEHAEYWIFCLQNSVCSALYVRDL